MCSDPKENMRKICANMRKICAKICAKYAQICAKYFFRLPRGGGVPDQTAIKTIFLESSDNTEHFGYTFAQGLGFSRKKFLDPTLNFDGFPNFF